MSLCIGLLAGTAAAGMEKGLEGATRLFIGRFLVTNRAQLLVFHPAFLILPAVGGLFSGLLVYGLIRRRAAQGTDLYLEAFHEHQGRLGLKTPAVQAVAAIGVIGCGGSAGPEGPIAALGSSLGSSLARLFRVRPEEQKNFLVAGCAAGVGAVFHSPLGGAFFATEVVYSDPDMAHEALIPSLVASVSGYVTFTYLTGHTGAFFPGVESVHFTRPAELPAYAALGILCVLGAGLLRVSLRATTALVGKLRTPGWFKPVVGGILCGAAACLVPQVLDPRYELLQQLLKTHSTGGAGVPGIGFGLLFLFFIMRAVATGLTIGSGNAGGILGPSVRIGGFCGAALGALLTAWFPGFTTPELQASLIAVGMSGVLVAGMRVPLAGLIMVLEMTHAYGLIVPLMLTSSVSYLFGRRVALSRKQVRNALESPACLSQVMQEVLEEIRVRDAVVPGSDRNYLEAGSTVNQAEASLGEKGLAYLPVLASNGLYQGMASRERLAKFQKDGRGGEAVEACSLSGLDALEAGMGAHEALEHLLAERLPYLPVVRSRENPRYEGYVSGHSVDAAFRAAVARVFTPLRDRMPDVAGLFLRQDIPSVLARLPGLTNVAESEEMRVPPEVVGKTLGECDFRCRYGRQVLAIRRQDGTLVLPASASDEMRAGDVLWAAPVKRTRG
ncbi:MAG: chloride channel protein [Planctomycetes bacterium]|nr:chloride channel protein [Planctomycetota bacterium]